jgi:hypothetical protein
MKILDYISTTLAYFPSMYNLSLKLTYLVLLYNDLLNFDSEVKLTRLKVCLYLTLWGPISTLVYAIGRHLYAK